MLFAYHEMGYACLEALIGMGAPIAALFTHHDAPERRNLVALMRGNGARELDPGSYAPRKSRRRKSLKSRRCGRQSFIPSIIAICCRRS